MNSIRSVTDNDRAVKTLGWNLQPSTVARNVLNPIRQIVDGMKISPNPNKEMIPLTIGRFSRIIVMFSVRV